MKLSDKIKKAYNKFIENMIRSNEKNFGAKRLDCCAMNRHENSRSSKHHE